MKKVKDIELDLNLYPDILKFLASGEAERSDPHHVLKLEFAERFVKREPRLLFEYNQEALLLAVEMRFAETAASFKESEYQANERAFWMAKALNDAHQTLVSFGLLGADKPDEDIF